MKNKITPTPHDALFKQFLADPETAKDLLDIHLPHELREVCDLSTLKLESGSFIEDNLRPYYSDVLYSLKTSQGDGYIYALIEHQSKPEKNMAFRMMRYAIAAMQSHLEAGHESLPLVIPIQFYHGKVSPYPYEMNWLKGFKNPTLAQALYTNEFPLIDVTVIPDDEIMQHKRIALLELVQKHIRQRDMLEFTEQLATLLSKRYTTDKQLRSLMSYMLQVGETSNLDMLIEKLTSAVPEHEETLMTIAEQLRREGEARGIQVGRQEGEAKGIQVGRREGEAKGIQVGRQDALNEMARNMLINGMEVQQIIAITGLTEKELALLSH